MANARRRFRSGLINWAMVVVSFSIPFLLLEVYLRTQPAPDVYTGDFDGVAAIGMPPDATVDLSWDEDGNSPVHIRSDNPTLVYEIRPHLDMYNNRIRTNSMGFRGPEIAEEKPEDVFRICVIGDSLTFGWMDHEDETFPHLLQEALRGTPAPDGRRFEVINMGVGGYNAEQELEVLRSKALPLDPDLILVQYCVNDVEVGADVGLWNHFTTTGSPMLDFVRLRSMQVRELFRARDLVERSYAGMVDAAHEAGTPLAFLFFAAKRQEYNDLYRRHLAYAREQGWPALGLYEPFDEAGWEAHMADDLHPNPAGNALATREIVRFLNENHFFTPGEPE